MSLSAGRKERKEGCERDECFWRDINKYSNGHIKRTESRTYLCPKIIQFFFTDKIVNDDGQRDECHDRKMSSVYVTPFISSPSDDSSYTCIVIIVHFSLVDTASMLSSDNDSAAIVPAILLVIAVFVIVVVLLLLFFLLFCFVVLLLTLDLISSLLFSCRDFGVPKRSRFVSKPWLSSFLRWCLMVLVVLSWSCCGFLLHGL